MEYDLYYYKCKELKDLHLMCMKLPVRPNKCKFIFDMWFKCVNSVNSVNSVNNINIK